MKLSSKAALQSMSKVRWRFVPVVTIAIAIGGSMQAQSISRPKWPETGSVKLVPLVVETAEGPRVPAEFGRLVVPENRHNPGTQSIELAFIRFKSTARVPGPPLIFLSGGPGNSGTRQAGALTAWRTKLLEIGDIILLDQRSTGLSLPKLDCPQEWDMPLDRPGSRAETLRIGLKRATACAEFWRSRDVDLRGYTTEESADDVEMLRQALGADKLNLWGASYGSHLALSTIRRHGDHINRAIIPAVEGPDHTIKLPSNIQRHMQSIGELVEADPAWSKLIPDFLGLVRQVLDRLEREPVTVAVPGKVPGQTVKVTVGKFDLQFATASGLGDLDAIARLPARYYAMAHGDFSWLATQMLQQRTTGFGNAMSSVMDCASGRSPERAARIEREARDTLLADAVDFQWQEMCGPWNAPDLGPVFRSLVKSDVPVLFISGTLDGRTPISNTEEIMAGFPNHQHLIVEGLSHTGAPLYNTPEILDAIAAHLRGQSIPIQRIAIPFQFEPMRNPQSQQ